MDAHETKLQLLLEGTKQYVIPLFQRVYCWQKSDWNELWRDLLDIYDFNSSHEHFMGAIVTLPVNLQPHGVNKFVLIDGQQRLTTVFVILAAIRDLVIGDELSEKINELYLINKFGKKINRLKLLPTVADKEVFQSIIAGQDVSGDSLLVDVYRFFKRKLRGDDEQGNPIDLNRMHDVIMEQLTFVSVVLGTNDSPYRIFHSLNGTGVPLTQADLVRNHFFMHIPDPDEQEVAFHDLWLPMQQKLGVELTNFMWRYITKDGTSIRQNRIYDEMRARTEGKNQAQVIDILSDMHTFSDYYLRLIDPDQEANLQIRRRLKRINRWEIKTAYPFLLNIFDEYENERLSGEQFCQILDMIESFVIRRFFCRVPTNALNKYFIALYNSLDENNIIGSMRKYLLARKWSTDNEFLAGWERLPIYASGLEKSRHILESLEEAISTNNEPVDTTHSRITREHILPQELTEVWETMLGRDATNIHAMYLHTIGNLTLTGMNESMGNKPYEEKKKVFANSGFALNKYFEQCTVWDSEAIQERAGELGKVALQIWQRPFVEAVVDKQSDDPTGHKPTGFSLFGDEYSALSWRDVLLDVCGLLAERHGETFASKVIHVGSSRRQYISNTDDGMIAPMQIEGTQLWVEANQSAKSIISIVKQVLRACGYDEREFNVDWE